MSDQEITVAKMCGLWRFTHARRKSSTVLSCFPFLDLPFEIHDHIYRLFLIAEMSILVAGGYVNDYFGNRSLETNEKPERARLRRSITAREGCHLKTNLLRVCTQIYREAAPILYSCNSFEFISRSRWDNFDLFCSRLTKTSREAIRSIDFLLLKMRILHCGSLMYDIAPRDEYETKLLIRSSGWLPKLERLRSYLWGDYVLRKLKCISGPNIDYGSSINLSKCLTFDEKFRYSEPTVRVISNFVEKLNGCGWQAVGNLKVVDDEPPFSEETKWEEWLQKNVSRG